MMVAGMKLVVNARVVGFLNSGDEITETERVPRGRCGVVLEGGAVVIGTGEQMIGLGGVLTAVYEAEVIGS